MENVKGKNEEMAIGTKITVVDGGNYNVKFVGEVSGSFSSKISTDYQACEDSFQRIELNDKITYFEIGEFQKEYNKSEKDGLIAQILYATCKANPEDEIISTRLTVLLPTLQMQNKQKLIDRLKKQEFNFKFNGDDRVVFFDDVMILPEGYISYFTLSDEDKKGSLAIIDIGSRTINISVVHNGKVQKLDTVKLGSYDFFSKIKKIENSKGEDYVEEDMERLINEGVVKVYQRQYAEFLNEILNSLKNIVSLKTYNVVFTGGTSLMLSDYINQLKLPKFKIHEDALNSNVKGALIASKMAWKDVVA